MLISYVLRFENILCVRVCGLGSKRRVLVWVTRWVPRSAAEMRSPSKGRRWIGRRWPRMCSNQAGLENPRCSLPKCITSDRLSKDGNVERSATSNEVIDIKDERTCPISQIGNA